MNFIEAVKLLQLDKNIKLMRRSKDFKIYTDTYGITKVISKEGYKHFTLLIDDALAEDWYVVKDEKLHTFEEAVVALKAGKKISRDYKYADVHKIGWDNKFIFEEEDLFANDWIIVGDETEK